MTPAFGPRLAAADRPERDSSTPIPLPAHFDAAAEAEPPSAASPPRAALEALTPATPAPALPAGPPVPGSGSPGTDAHMPQSTRQSSAGAHSAEPSPARSPAAGRFVPLPQEPLPAQTEPAPQPPPPPAAAAIAAAPLAAESSAKERRDSAGGAGRAVSPSPTPVSPQGSPRQFKFAVNTGGFLAAPADFAGRSPSPRGAFITPSAASSPPLATSADWPANRHGGVQPIVYGTHGLSHGIFQSESAATAERSLTHSPATAQLAPQAPLAVPDLPAGLSRALPTQ